jgi:hypothetical protein
VTEGETHLLLQSYNTRPLLLEQACILVLGIRRVLCARVGLQGSIRLREMVRVEVVEHRLVPAIIIRAKARWEYKKTKKSVM